MKKNMHLNRNDIRVFYSTLNSAYSISETSYFIINEGVLYVFGTSYEQPINTCMYTKFTDDGDSPMYQCTLYDFMGWCKNQIKLTLVIDLSKGTCRFGDTVYSLQQSRHPVPIPEYEKKTHSILTSAVQLNKLFLILSLSSPFTVIKTKKHESKLYFEAESISLASETEICSSKVYDSTQTVCVFSKFLKQITNVAIYATCIRISINKHTCIFLLDIGKSQQLVFKNKLVESKKKNTGRLKIKWK